MTKRYNTKEWKRLVEIQNQLTNIDILTITGFMRTHEELVNHLRNCEEKLARVSIR